ncbi:MAG: transcriptional regulator [Planctomycetes bacterium]|nr:transcriptional regulator [Planctomycetota bacterium]MCB9830093.1 transcriptional regulator [Planctomycetota bacterium]MCB9899926.1 transcriptional regulator [Planctomycetota bacterium]
MLAEARLGIVAALLARPEATFSELKDLLGLTQGNLGAHLQRLEAAGYVTITKAFVGRRPRTTVQLTAAGRDAFRRHVDRLQRFLEGGA